jgi:hypothetical protein
LHEAKVWKPWWGKGRWEHVECRAIHADEFHDRRMTRVVPASHGVPEGAGKIRRECQSSF